MLWDIFGKIWSMRRPEEMSASTREILETLADIGEKQKRKELWQKNADDFLAQLALGRVHPEIGLLPAGEPSLEFELAVQDSQSREVKLNTVVSIGEDSKNPALQRTILMTQDLGLSTPEFTMMALDQPDGAKLLTKLVELQGMPADIAKRAADLIGRFLGREKENNEDELLYNPADFRAINKTFERLLKEAGESGDVYVQRVLSKINGRKNKAEWLELEEEYHRILKAPLVQFSKFLEKGESGQEGWENIYGKLGRKGESLEEFKVRFFGEFLGDQSGMFGKLEAEGLVKEATAAKFAVTNEVRVAKLLALAIYDRAAWRKYTRIELGAEGGKFTAEGSVSFPQLESEDKLIEVIGEVVPQVLARGVVDKYNFDTLSKENGSGVALSSTPTVVPLCFRYDQDGEIVPTARPEVFVGKIGSEFGDGKSAVVEVEFSDGEPGSVVELMNSPEWRQKKRELEERSDAPLMARMVYFRKTRQLVSLWVSDHTVTDGGPLDEDVSKAVLAGVAKKLGGDSKGLRIAGLEKEWGVDDLVRMLPTDRENIGKLEEISALMPVSSIVELRQLLKDLAEQGRLFDYKGRPIEGEDLDKFGIGALVTVFWGHLMQEVAIEHGLSNGKSGMGALAAADNLTVQLMQMNVGQLLVSGKLNEMMEVKDDSLVLSEDFAQRMRTLGHVFRTVGTEVEGTAIVRQIAGLWEATWKANALASRYVFAKQAKDAMAEIMMSVIRGVGGPALAQVQEMATTYGLIDKELGVMMTKMRIRRKGPEAVKFAEDYIRRVYDWNEEMGAGLGEIKKQLGLVE